VLHTLPPRKSQSPPKLNKKSESGTKQTSSGDSGPVSEDQDPPPMEEDLAADAQKTPITGSSKAASSLSYTTLVTPKLITCVEVIKREWIDLQKANIQSKSWPKENHEEEYAHGLEQYNEMSVLEEVADLEKDFVVENQPNLRGLDEASEGERPGMIIDLLTKKKL